MWERGIVRVNYFKENKVQEKNITCTCSSDALMSGRVSSYMLRAMMCVVDTKTHGNVQILPGGNRTFGWRKEVVLCSPLSSHEEIWTFFSPEKWEYH